jgi:hypothetical protein
VLSGTAPAPNALVYRLPAGQPRGAKPFADGAGVPFKTNAQGYLQGRGALNIGDQLVALLPITGTNKYMVYATNATPTAAGLSAYTVAAPGVQTLTVSPARPLVLFNLSIALEWDARRDTQFLSQLQFDLRRASELLYDWTNGQAALGQITIYHDRQQWNDADIRVYASNRLRPNATQGGIVARDTTDPAAPQIVYQPGQVRIGAVWNRYGDSSGSLGEDWPRTLAHELGHYALYLDDNYLGLDNGLLVTVNTCTGTAMADPYRDDYSEFHRAADWLTGCQNTLANLSTRRADWATITTFYPWLNGTTINPGPSGLPLEVTDIRVIEPVTSTSTLDVPIFYLSQNGGIVQPGSSARAFLFQGNRITDLGRPTIDQVLARGARPGDRLCVYELSAPIPRLGCKKINPGEEQLALINKSDWQPEVIVSPTSSRRIAVQVKGAPAGLGFKARLYPVDLAAGPEIDLTGTAVYSGVFNLATPATEGYIHVWVNEAEPRREAVVDYTLGGSPARIRGRWAPATSADGQVVLFGNNLTFPAGEFFTLQAATTLPSPPSWGTVVGQGYWLSASARAPSLTSASVSFSYLGSEAPPGQEQWLKVYFWDGASWRPLKTDPDIYHNIASARSVGPGLYALMTSVEIPLAAGVNVVAYPIHTSRTVEEALASIAGDYTRVRGYDSAAQRWRVLGPNDELEFGKGYEITVSQAVTWLLKGDGITSGASAASANNYVSAAPAIYSGVVHGDASWTPAAGLPVVARVNGQPCGQGGTLADGERIIYGVAVAAEIGLPGCGAPGRVITFQVGSKVMQTTIGWNNERVWELGLQ